ncbi:MAG TPA: helix-turn-helix domain-containing protein, partial [Prosthecobacter sp.]|nr:helix-turn-helix domain-containing protein [Prosthecobacter sp.]
PPASQPQPAQAESAAPPRAELDVHEMERQLIMQAVERCGGNRSDAAALLNISRRTLQRKLKEMGMVRKHRPRAPRGGAAAAG